MSTFGRAKRAQAARPAASVAQIRARAIRRLLAIAEDAGEKPEAAIAACRALLDLPIEVEAMPVGEATATQDKLQARAAKAIAAAFSRIGEPCRDRRRVAGFAACARYRGPVAGRGRSGRAGTGDSEGRPDPVGALGEAAGSTVEEETRVTSSAGRSPAATTELNQAGRAALRLRLTAMRAELIAALATEPPSIPAC